MTIDQLIERLEEYRDLVGGDAEVRLMTQQNWPFENSITGVCSGEEINDAADEDDPDDDGDIDDDAVLYIVEGQQLGYYERFKKPPTWKSKLVPTENKDVVDGIRCAFKAILRGESVGSVARELNRRKIKTAQGNSFTFSNTMCILKNPAYAGTLRVGHYGRGKFTRVAEDGLITRHRFSVQRDFSVQKGFKPPICPKLDVPNLPRIDSAVGPNRAPHGPHHQLGYRFDPWSSQP
jgi:hypothetical protein